MRYRRAEDTAQVALSAALFATERLGWANHVALQWAASVPCDSFEVVRTPERGGRGVVVYRGTGTSCNDYGLAPGGYRYQLVAQRAGKPALTARSQRVAPVALSPKTSEYSNQTGFGREALGEPLRVGKTYYRFPGQRVGKSVRFTVQTSRDGILWHEGPVVLDATSHPDLDDFKFEASTIFYDPRRHKIVWWCHWERSQGYADGRAFVATATPGERFTVHHITNPLGLQVRDMSVFRDDDGQGYLVAASNGAGQGANATLALFKLSPDYTEVTALVGRVMENQYREAPHLLKHEGYYYLFFSQAAGWYPSRAGYLSTRSLAGGWSEPRTLGNTSTFAAQSGGILTVGQGRASLPVLMANRWIRGEGTSPNAVLPLRCVDGFVFADYAPTLLLDLKESTRQPLVPLHEGVLLSQGRPTVASIPGNAGAEVARAFDGDYSTAFQSDQKTWPFFVTCDLGARCGVINVQISWHLHKGSEAYYRYLIEGSDDGVHWRTLLSRTDDSDTRVSKTYGFTSDLLPEAPAARFVRVQVLRAVLHNNPNNWYPPTLYEVKIYGRR